MANGIRIGDPRGFNKGRSSKFCEGSGGHISQNVVEIAIKVKTIVRKPLMIKTQLTCWSLFCQSKAAREFKEGKRQRYILIRNDKALSSFLEILEPGSKRVI